MDLGSYLKAPRPAVKFLDKYVSDVPNVHEMKCHSSRFGFEIAFMLMKNPIYRSVLLSPFIKHLGMS